jgi:DNA-binding transcriptional regulator YdaS (Cro superfamily)
MSDFWPHVRRAVELVGGQSELARRIGMSQPSVHDLCHRTKRMQADIALKIEAATDGQVSRSDLLPSVWPPGESSPPAAPYAAGTSAGAGSASPAVSSVARDAA